MKFHFKYQQEKKAPSWDPRSKSRELQKKLLRQNPGEGARLGKQLRSKWDQRVKNRKKNIFESGMHPCMLSCFSLTLFNPMDYSPPGSSVHEILQAELLEWVTMPSSRGSSQPGVKTTSLTSNLHWQSGSLPLVHLGRPWIMHQKLQWLKIERKIWLFRNELPKWNRSHRLPLILQYGS